MRRPVGPEAAPQAAIPGASRATATLGKAPIPLVQWLFRLGRSYRAY